MTAAARGATTAQLRGNGPDPAHEAAITQQLRGSGPREYAEALDLLANRRLVVLTGAGLSTDSGIPDYRGPGSPNKDRTPMNVAEFRSGPAAQQRYWAR